MVWNPGYNVGWIPGWSYGSQLYNWGFTSYANPYVVVQPTTTVVGPFNYSQPIDTAAPPPPEDATQAAMDAFDRARTVFTEGDFRQALVLTNQALKELSNDPAIHEFRALVLFALQQYDDASQALYAVLSVGPGWDWTTMISLYPDAEVYTQQLRRLEQYVKAHPESASAQFLLAYHYLTMGSVEEAAALLRKVVALKPTDQLSRRILALIEESAKAKPDGEPLPTPAEATAPAGDSDLAESEHVLEQIKGTWQAQPDESTTIVLTLRDDSTFEWQVRQQGDPRSLTGKYSFGGGLLTLASDDGGAIVGNVIVSSPDAFEFRLAGSAASEPGLRFARK